MTRRIGTSIARPRRSARSPRPSPPSPASTRPRGPATVRASSAGPPRAGLRPTAAPPTAGAPRGSGGAGGAGPGVHVPDRDRPARAGRDGGDAGERLQERAAVLAQRAGRLLLVLPERDHH